eukprot:12912632-Prorocentrum_lima.AAC.1
MLRKLAVSTPTAPCPAGINPWRMPSLQTPREDIPPSFRPCWQHSASTAASPTTMLKTTHIS